MHVKDRDGSLYTIGGCRAIRFDDKHVQVYTDEDVYKYATPTHRKYHGYNGRQRLKVYEENVLTET